ncbi:MAG: beta-galactosidase [Planctomycetes bacterium]|nr:beta-galactosidase [Planctomycetota bacterium]
MKNEKRSVSAGLTARVELFNGRPMLFINGEPTTEFWCYGDPNAIEDFASGGIRICQFHVPFPSWWTGPQRYDFGPTDEKIEAFCTQAGCVLLIPRVNFGYVGEEWWGELHPDQLAVGQDLHGRPVDYRQVRTRPVGCWFSSGSQEWTRDATRSMRAFVTHCEERFGDRVLGYQIGGGISAEWFRWWNFVEDVFEDYSPAAREAFRRYLRNRYGDDAALREAWGRSDVTVATAEVPSPGRLQQPSDGYFRHPVLERDVVDWLECLSEENSGQIIALAKAAKEACRWQKLVGTFYGYLWPHWNTRSAARAGHLALRRILAEGAIDFISSPYHYDNRHLGGFHHSQTVPQTIERAGKLHLDEIDTFTHLVKPTNTVGMSYRLPRSAHESCLLLRRDAASVLGTAGTGWWMDLHHDRWYADPQIQAEIRRLQRLALQRLAWSGKSHAEVAMVVDDRSSAWCHPTSPLNQFFTSMPRQLEWSDLGFPVDTLTAWEVGRHGRHRVYLFLNCWFTDKGLRREITQRVRRPGVTSIWFHGCGYLDESRCDVRNLTELVGIRMRHLPEPMLPEIELIPGSHPVVEGGQAPFSFGARLSRDHTDRVLAGPGAHWSAGRTPRFAVDDPRATVIGRYADGGQPALAMVEKQGWRSIFCGAPMLPGWLLAGLARRSGVHAYTSPGAQVFHRGPLLSVYKPEAGSLKVEAPGGELIQPLVFAADQQSWQPDRRVEPRASREDDFEANETRFYITRDDAPAPPLPAGEGSGSHFGAG